MRLGDTPVSIASAVEKGEKKYTNATIWHVDENNICLKGGAYIPVKRVFKIVF